MIYALSSFLVPALALGAAQEGGRLEPGELLEAYCVTCHNAALLAGELDLNALDPDRVGDDAETWERVVRKLRTGLMPPAGARRPDRAALDAFAAGLEDALDRAASLRPNPGAPVLHRLNRAEYANAVRDLLDLPVDAAALLPADDSSNGFDNVAAALNVSPALMQAYVAAAGKISRMAVGDATISPARTTYRPARGLSQDNHIEGLGLGTRGGMAVDHVFPLDAEYVFDIGRSGGGFGQATTGGSEAVEIAIDGERVALAAPDGLRGIRLRVEAGPRRVTAAVVSTRSAVGVDDLYSRLAVSPGVANVSIFGPFDPTGPGDTPSRRRIFSCRPAAEAGERACAMEILGALARRAFRRAVDDADPKMETLMGFFESGRELRGFETGIQYGVARILVDPEFVFRFEDEPSALADGRVYELDGLELATRLSFFLWSSIPDARLLDAAAAGRLSDPEALEAEARRMLADRRAGALVENFASQWLLLRQLDTVAPASNDFDGNLRRSFRRETEMLFESILREDRSIMDLIDADYTFIDERLARHYGVPNVRGSRFRRVSVEDEHRRGLLGHGSVLTVTSAVNRTSPVKRGHWILENLLGATVPLPPPGVESNLDESADAGPAPASMRRRLERHRADPACASCHAIMDPIGFALENFDSVGKWRDADGGAPIDASGEMADGTAIDGPASLRRALMDRRDAFAAVAVEKLLTYALGRTVDHDDMPAVRSIVRGAASDDYRLSSLVLGVVASDAFRSKIKVSDEARDR